MKGKKVTIGQGKAIKGKKKRELKANRPVYLKS